VGETEGVMLMFVGGLSKWVRQKVQYFSMFHNAHQSLEQFTHDRCSQLYADESR